MGKHRSTKSQMNLIEWIKDEKIFPFTFQRQFRISKLYRYKPLVAAEPQNTLLIDQNVRGAVSQANGKPMYSFMLARLPATSLSFFFFHSI